MRVARQIAPHVASVNASTEQRGEQRFQPHVELFVERLASQCESTMKVKRQNYSVVKCTAGVDVHVDTTA